MGLVKIVILSLRLLLIIFVHLDFGDCGESSNDSDMMEKPSPIMATLHLLQVMESPGLFYRYFNMSFMLQPSKQKLYPGDCVMPSLKLSRKIRRYHIGPNHGKTGEITSGRKNTRNHYCSSYIRRSMKKQMRLRLKLKRKIFF